MAINIIKWSIAALLLSVIAGLFKLPFQPVVFFCAFCCIAETTIGWLTYIAALRMANKVKSSVWDRL